MGFGAHAMLWMRFHPSPTSAKGSLRLPGLRILSHKGRGISAALPRVIRNVAESRYGAAGLPLPLWERIASPCEAQQSIWARLVRGEASAGLCRGLDR
jgi:hypothetical protein